MALNRKNKVLKKKRKEKKNNFFSGNKNVQQIRQKQKIALCIKLNESAVQSL